MQQHFCTDTKDFLDRCLGRGEGWLGNTLPPVCVKTTQTRLRAQRVHGNRQERAPAWRGTRWPGAGRTQTYSPLHTPFVPSWYLVYHLLKETKPYPLQGSQA